MSDDGKDKICLHSKIFNSIRQSRSNGEHCDVTIEVEGQAFKAHKCILAAQSQFFKAMFQEGKFQEQDGQCKLKDVSKEAFSAILEVLYGDSTIFRTQPEELLIDALQVADMLCIDVFINECKAFVDKNKYILLGKCYELLLKLDRMSDDLLKRQADLIPDFVSKYFEQPFPSNFPELFDFKLVSFHLAHVSVSGFLKGYGFRNTYCHEELIVIKKTLNFIFQWYYSSGDLESEYEMVEELLALVPFNDVPLKSIGNFLNSTSCFLKHIDTRESTSRYRMCNFIRDRFIQLNSYMAGLGFSVWVVQYKDYIVSIKEYDFNQRRCIETENMLDEVPEHFCVTGQGMVHLVTKEGAIYDVDAKRFPWVKRQTPLDGDLSVIDCHSQNNEIYLLCSDSAETNPVYRIYMFDVKTKEWLNSETEPDLSYEHTRMMTSSGNQNMLFSTRKKEIFAVIKGYFFKINRCILSLKVTRINLSYDTYDVFLNQIFWNQQSEWPCEKFTKGQVVNSADFFHSICSFPTYSLIATCDYNVCPEIQMVDICIEFQTSDSQPMPYFDSNSIGFVPLDIESDSLIGVFLAPTPKEDCQEK